MNVLVFDIETIPDIATARKLHDFSGLDDGQVVEAMYALQRQKANGSEFLPHYLQQIVAISLVLQTDDKIQCWSLGDLAAEEPEIISRFYKGLEKYQPTLVSWNGTGFDCPVLNYRSLLHGISAPLYWEVGDNEQSFRWNNYQNRYHYRHLDVMDVLASYSGRANAALDNVATMLGFPGKMGMSGAKVYQAYANGDIQSIRDYCETDVLNTYLVYLRFELLRGKLDEASYQQQLTLTREWLEQANKPHFREFLANW